MDWGNMTTEDLDVSPSSRQRILLHIHRPQILFQMEQPVESLLEFKLVANYALILGSRHFNTLSTGFFSKKKKCYRTKCFIMIMFFLGMGFVCKPLAIVAALLTGLSIRVLNDRYLLLLPFQHLRNSCKKLPGFIVPGLGDAWELSSAT